MFLLYVAVHHYNNSNAVKHYLQLYCVRFYNKVILAKLVPFKNVGNSKNISAPLHCILYIRQKQFIGKKNCILLKLGNGFP